MYLPECEMTFHLLAGSIYLFNYQRKGGPGGKGPLSQILPEELGREETNPLLSYKWGKSGPWEVTVPTHLLPVLHKSKSCAEAQVSLQKVVLPTGTSAHGHPVTTHHQELR